jgi:hypothetical protein
MVKIVVFHFFNKLWQYKLNGSVYLYVYIEFVLKGENKCIWNYVLEMGLVNIQLHQTNI